MPPLADRLDTLLPQTQCTRCGYADCRAYAEAIANEGAPIDRCPPGGEATLQALAAVTGQAAAALDPACGTPGPLRVAVIDEAHCIGCTLCIAACPVDAIVGAQKRMHGVLAALCSGCELCLAPCPVDCIAMVPAGRAWNDADARDARERHRAHKARLVRRARAGARRAEVAGHAGAACGNAGATAARRQATVAAAVARARARRSAT